MEETNILPVLQVVLEITLLIVFFVMAGNIAAIKKSLKKVKNENLVDYFMYLSKQDIILAQEAILRAFYKEILDPRLLFDSREKYYNEMIKFYKPYFDKVDLAIPAYPFLKDSDKLA